MAVNNSLQSRSGGKPKFSVAIQTPMYQKLVNDTLGDPDRARRFVAAISSAVAVNPSLQECDAGTVLTAALLGESLNLSPSPQLGQYYMVPYSSIKRMKRRIRLWEKQYAAGEVSREKIMESFTAWEAHAKHGDTKQLRREMRSRLLMALDRADEARRAAGIPAARPGPDERRTKRYGTVTFQSGKRQPGEAGGKQQAHQVHQAGQ